MRKISQIVTFFSCLLWIAIPLHAQYSYEKDYSSQQFTNENGLPQNSINFIVSDKSGFIWMGTEGGLVRFDGKNFKTFLAPGGNTQASRFHHAINSMERGSFFAVNTQEDIFTIKEGIFTPYKGQLSPSYWKMYKLALQENKYLDFGQLRVKIMEGMPVKRIIVKDEADFYFISVDSISYYSNAQKTYSLPHPKKTFLNYFLLNGELYMHAGSNSFYYLDQAKKQFRLVHAQGLPQDSTKPFLYWHMLAKRAYYRSQNILYELKQRADKSLYVDTLLTGFDFEKHNIISVYHDESTGNLFLGSFTEGIFYLKKHLFQVLMIDNANNDNVFYGQDYWKNNTVITPQGYILGKGISKKWYNGNILFNRYSILKSSYGRKSVWAKCGRDLFELDTNANLIHSWVISDATPVENIGTEINLLYEREGTLWFAMRDGRIYYLNVADIQPQPNLLVTIPRPTYIKQIRTGELWVSSVKGLYKVDYTKKKSQVTQVLKDIYINSMYVDERQNMWCTAMDDGLLLYRNNKVHKFPLDDELFLRESHCIVEDKAHNFWVSGNRGLIKIPKQDLLDYADGKITGLYYFYYTKEYGLNSNEFNGGCEPCGVRWPNGNITFPSIAGLVLYAPKDIPPNLPDSKIIIEDLWVDGNKAKACDTLYLDHDFQRVSMHFATPYLGNYKNLKLQVAIQGSSQDTIWHNLGDEQSFTFNTLPYGTHTLLVRKAIGSNKYMYASLMVKVKAAYWETWWFILLSVISICLLLYFLVRLRLNYITQKNIELENLISDRTHDLSETVNALQKSKEQLREKSNLQQKIILAFSHDLKSPLMYLMLTGQKLYEDIHKVPEEMSDSVKMMYDSSFSIYHSMDNFLNYAKIYFIKDNLEENEFSLHELIQEKINVFKLIAKSKNLEINSDVQANIYLRSNQVALSIVLHNLLDNSIKYTDEGQISIYSESYGDYVSIHIKDTGMGMDESEVNEYSEFFLGHIQLKQSHEFAVRGVGLQIVKEMMDMLKGKVELESQEEVGTHVTLTFKTEGNQHGWN